jgi:nicotinamidase-related amidase
MRTVTRFALAASALLLAASPAHTASAQKPSPSLLTPQNSTLILIDHEPQFIFSLASMDRGLLMNNVAGLAKTAKLFGVPTILTSGTAEAFAGPIIPEITSVFPGQAIIDRTNINAWEDRRVADAVKAAGRKKLIVAGLWTEVCVALPVLSALDEGYEVYVVTDASGGWTKDSHDAGVQRMVAAGAKPISWLAVLFEYQRDWARTGTYAGVTSILAQHAGALGAGGFYAQTMVHRNRGAAGATTGTTPTAKQEQ